MKLLGGMTYQGIRNHIMKGSTQRVCPLRIFGIAPSASAHMRQPQAMTLTVTQNHATLQISQLSQLQKQQLTKKLKQDPTSSVLVHARRRL